jgi:hypothetical protein
VVSSVHVCSASRFAFVMTVHLEATRVCVALVS